VTRDVRTEIRQSAAEKAAWIEHAGAVGLSEFVRQIVNEHIGFVNGDEPALVEAATEAPELPVEPDAPEDLDTPPEPQELALDLPVESVAGVIEEAARWACAKCGETNTFYQAQADPTLCRVCWVGRADIRKPSRSPA